MASEKGKTKLIVNTRLAEADDRELPAGAVYLFDDAGRFLSSAPLPTGDRNQVELDLPAGWRGRAVRVLMGPAPKEMEDDDETPPWVSELLREQGELAKGQGAQTLKRLGAIEKRVRLNQAETLLDLVAYPVDWLKWLTCLCVVRGRLVKRVHMPDGTTQLWGVCHACILVYEVDAYPLIIAKLPDRDLFRLRDDLIRFIKPEPKIPPERLAKIKPRIWPPPPPPPPEEFIRPLSFGAGAGGNPGHDNPGPAEATLAGLEGVFEAPSASILREEFLSLGPFVIRYLCVIPWFMQYFEKHLITWTCTDERGYFEVTVPYTCAGDHPDIYFRAGQCIGGQWHWLYDPGVRCHTHWNYPCGSEVILETTDPAARVCAPPEVVDPPPGVSTWILINKIRHTLINSIGTDGLLGVDFIQPDGSKIRGAPFGGQLGFRISHSADIPTNPIKYYRWLYRKDAVSEWSEFGTPLAPSVGRHYADYDLTQPLKPPTFPVYTLGPKSVGAMTLYEFRPQLADLQAMEPPNHRYEWPVEPIGNDIFSAHLDSPSLPGGPGSALGKYWFRLEVYDHNGNQVLHGTDFDFIVLTTEDGDSRLAAANEIVDGGFEFPLYIDNRVCEATIDAPTIGAVGADPVCGFLRYDPGDDVDLDFHALHPASSYAAPPANRATFLYELWRGANKIKQATGNVGDAVAGEWSGDTDGNFSEQFAVTNLLGKCSEAAFAETLYVYAKAIDGEHRLHAYDARDVWAFALAPKP